MSIAQQLAERILAFNDNVIPDVVRHWARQAIMDTIGVTLAGASELTVRIPAQVPGIGEQHGPCLVLGTRRRTTALDAAFLNGIASHALDYDDVSPSMGGHPSVMLVPTILALGEMFDSSGIEALTAYIAGYETETKIARAVNFHHYEKGWHPTATLGIFGTTAAAARLMHLTQNQTARALAIAASLASGIKANFGTMTKPLHVGQSVRNGILAASLAQGGFSANVQAFEHPQGFFEVFNGAGNYDANNVFDRWANPLDLLEPGLGIKQFPCCGSTHMAITMMLTLKQKHALTPECVRHIQIYMHPQRLPHTNRPVVTSALEAKFSVQYCVARALLHGKVLLEHFEGDAWSAPNVQALLAKTDAGTNAALSNLPWGAEVIVELTDGSRISERVDYLMGRGKENPMNESEMWVKFEDCATRCLHPNQTADLFAKVGQFEHLASVRELTQLCEPIDLAVEQLTD